MLDIKPVIIRKTKHGYQVSYVTPDHSINFVAKYKRFATEIESVLLDETKTWKQKVDKCTGLMQQSKALKKQRAREWEEVKAARTIIRKKRARKNVNG